MKDVEGLANIEEQEDISDKEDVPGPPAQQQDPLPPDVPIVKDDVNSNREDPITPKVEEEEDDKEVDAVAAPKRRRLQAQEYVLPRMVTPRTEVQEWNWRMITRNWVDGDTQLETEIRQNFWTCSSLVALKTHLVMTPPLVSTSTSTSRMTMKD